MAFSAAEDVRTADSRRHGPKFKNPKSRAGRRDESPDVVMGGPKSLRLENIYNINCIHEFSISPNREYLLILNFSEFVESRSPISSLEKMGRSALVHAPTTCPVLGVRTLSM